MNIAILGAGRVGGVLGRRWAAAGHRIVYGSRNPLSQRIQKEVADAGENAKAAPLAEAAQDADVVVLCAPWSAAEEVVKATGEMEGKVLVDCTNPVTDDFRDLALGHDTSAAEKIAAWAPKARVVKAFNSVSTATMADPSFNGDQAAMFCCGDDDQAKQTVIGLGEELGLDVYDVGPLTAARFLEPFAMMYIQLAIKEGWGGDCAFKVLSRERKTKTQS